MSSERSKYKARSVENCRIGQNRGPNLLQMGTILILLCLSALFLFPVSVFSEESGKQSQTKNFSIKAQSLKSALDQFAEQANVSFAYKTGDISNLQSSEVSGILTPEEGLNQLLNGTGVTFQFTGSSTVTLSRKDNLALQLKPILVEGERRRANIKDTASSVVVIDDEDMQNLPGPAELRNILRQVPNVLDTGIASALTFRGQDSNGVLFGADSFIGANRPRITVSMDGRPLSTFEYVFTRTPAWDLEQVEVFRSPQTATQGRNSIAGAVFFRTQDPVYRPESRFRLTAGNFATRQFSGMANTPLIEDELAVRFAFDKRDHESFVNFSGVPAGSVADEIRDDDFLNFRGKILYEPKSIPGLSAKLTISNNEANRPQVETVVEPFDSLEQPLASAPIFTDDTRTYILNVNYQINDNWETRNMVTYADSEVTREPANPGAGFGIIRLDQTQVESILDYQNDSMGLKALFGVNALFTQNLDDFDLSNFGSPLATFDGQQRSVGGFAQVTWSVLKPLDLIAGLRYQNDHQKRRGGAGLTIIPGEFNETFDEILPSFGVAYRPMDNVTVGVDVKKAYNPGGFTTVFVTGDFVRFKKETAWNYEAYWRTNWLDNRLQFNGNFFYTDFKDQQRGAIISVAPIQTLISNAEDARSLGAEFDFRFLATKQLELNGSLGLLDTEIKEFADSTAGDLTGNEFQRAPSITANIGFKYQPIEGLYLIGQGQYVDDYFNGDQNTQEINGFFIANAQLSYQFHKNVRAFGAVTNIGDRLYELQNFSSLGSSVGDPREFYGGLEVSFW